MTNMKNKMYTTRVFLSLTFIMLLAGVLFLGKTSSIKAAPAEIDELHIHYARFDENYSNWDIWLWIEGVGSEAIPFTGTDTFGKYGVVDLTTSTLFGNITNNSELGIIIRKGGDAWSDKDPSSDRFFRVGDLEVVERVAHVYSVTGLLELFTSKEAAMQPQILFASFITKTSINAQVAFGTPISYRVLANDVSVQDGTLSSKNISLAFTETINFQAYYVLEVTCSFEGSTVVLSTPISMSKFFDDASWQTAFNYPGDDLGFSYTNSQTTFKLWAPISADVKLKLYNKGTPVSVSASKGDDTVRDTIPMTRENYGVWSAVVTGDLHNVYYNFVINNGAGDVEVVDPYAKSTGINGLRGLVVDFSKTNPEGWEYNVRPSINNLTELVIYELHVRDLTSSDTWTGKESNRGKFLGLVEEGTTYTAKGETVKTGFDHIKELGVTAVQLLPIFDYKNDLSEDRVSFNWGYNPQNFNALDGSYSSDPHDGLSRIKEFKEAVWKFNENGIGVIMDVVYNHMHSAGDSSFEKIVPGYFFRHNSDGSFSNGSGCGNETKSERYMMQKFMIDSTMFWAEEYNLIGYRFDLMALHDKTTMAMLAAKLHDRDPQFAVYGEPWTGGTTPLPDSEQANIRNIAGITGVGAFNDVIRDGLIKSGMSALTDRGWIQSDSRANTADKAGWSRLFADIRYGIAGSIDMAETGYTGTKYGSPLKSINYVTCHDNYTLLDKLNNSTSASANTKAMSIQANAIVLTSQGVPFLHAGEELGRIKKNSDGTPNGNSYNFPDSVNQLDWGWKITNKVMFDSYKSLISLRKESDLFKLTTPEAIKERLSFLSIEDYLSYTLHDESLSDTQYKEIVMLFNNNTTSVKFHELSKEYVVYHDSSGTFTPGTVLEEGSRIILRTSSSVILVRGKTAEPGPGPGPEDNTLLIVASVGGGAVGLGGLGALAYYLMRKRKLVK